MATAEHEAPLCLGRDAELERLHAALDAALAGRGALVLLAGDPGIGKTRLAEVLAVAAGARGADVVWGRCWEAGGAPAYWPWTEALRALVAERGAESLAAVAPGAAREAARLVPALGAAPDTEPDADRFALFDGVAELLLAAARERPLMLVLEDLHAADPTSLLLLDLLASRLSPVPLLAVATHRVGDPAAGAATEDLLARLARRGDSIALGGLGADATRELARVSTGAELNDEDLAGLQRRTEGNPFFVQSLARVLQQPGGPVSQQALPAGVRDAVARRVVPLSQGTRRLLDAAAVLGRQFGLARLARLRAMDPADALELIGPALQAGLVVEGPAAGELRFTHALIRDWLYGELDRATRAELHRREAEALEDEARRDPELLYELAHHRLAAVPVGDATAALNACELAARHADAALAFEDAAVLYERALALADRALATLQPIRRAELLLSLGAARQRAGRSEDARGAFAEAANLARSASLADELARAALGFGAIVLYPGETDRTLVALLEQALELVPARDAGLRSQLLARLARELHFSPDVERPRALATEAVTLAQSTGDAGAQAFAMHAWHVANDVPETVEGRAEVAEGIVVLARDAGEPDLELSGWVLAAIDLIEMGEPDLAAERLAEAEALALRLRQPALTWRVALVQGTLALLAGRFEEAERVIDQAYSAGRSARGRGAYRYWVLQKGELASLRGGYAELEDDFRQVSEEAEATWGELLPRLLAATGRLDEARPLFERSATRGFGGPIDDMAALPVVAASAEVCVALQDTERAAAIYELLLPHADRWSVSAGAACTGTVRMRLGPLAALLGDLDTARDHLELAVAAHRRAGAAPLTALAEAELAGVLRALGEAGRAGELEGHALRTSRALGMRPLAERLEAGSPAAAPGPAASARLEREGEYWMADFAGRAVRLRDRRGIGHLARLIERPHLEIGALQLAGGEESAAADSDAGAMLDEEAKRSYRRRLDELRAEIDEARSWNDPERTVRAEAELEFLTAELGRAVGLGGRDRRAASNAERARVSVTRAIRSAIEAIAEQHPELGAHLDASVRTGIHCRYAPAAGDEVSWRVSGGPPGGATA